MRSCVPRVLSRGSSSGTRAPTWRWKLRYERDSASSGGWPCSPCARRSCRRSAIRRAADKHVRCTSVFPRIASPGGGSLGHKTVSSLGCAPRSGPPRRARPTCAAARRGRDTRSCPPSLLATRAIVGASATDGDPLDRCATDEARLALPALHLELLLEVPLAAI